MIGDYDHDTIIYETNTTGERLTNTMIQADFLRRSAAELRSLAQRDIEIADALRRMADDLDGKAAQLDGYESHSRHSDDR
jgi:hypothetical protein